MSYTDFFQQCTGHSPYPYQQRLGEDAGSQSWPDLLDIPTGLGKTAAVGVAWLWARQQNPGETPRRLVYCLPMRTLVEQTCQSAEKWLANAGLDQEIGLHMMMGGDVDAEWAESPKSPPSSWARRTCWSAAPSTAATP